MPPLFLVGVLGMVLFALTDAALHCSSSSSSAIRSWRPTRGRCRWCQRIAALMFVLRGTGDYLATYFPGRVGRQVIKAIRSDVFAHYLHLPSAYYDQESSGVMLSRLTYNTEQVAEATRTR
jgi:subfamily B ATP-binding cassette protein MsbA